MKAMGSQPNLSTRSEMVSIYKCPHQNFGAVPQISGTKKHQTLDHFLCDFRTWHCLSPERNVASTNKNAIVDLQYVP